MEAEITRLELSGDALRGLSPERRYLFSLAGHIFNEIMLLQKWLHVSRAPPGQITPQLDASVDISMLLVRLVSAKVYEALGPDTLTKASTDTLLRADMLGLVDGLEEKWNTALVQYAGLEWLGWVRNKCGFHYMSPGQWIPHLTDDLCEGAYVYIGKRYADTLYHWAEISASMQHYGM